MFDTQDSQSSEDHPTLDPSEINTEFAPNIISPTFSTLAKNIRANSRSLSNRLKSIHQDGLFVCKVANCPGFKTAEWSISVIANKRAGEWYVRQDGKWYSYAGSCYFKSTDGHFGNWGVSRRRLNLSVLEVLHREGERGVIIVDSTRRGKRFPDSISKTIPIWLATLNHLFFPSATHDLYTPPSAVPATEVSQIVSRISFFISHLQSLGINWGSLPYKPSKPLRPIFITSESHLPQAPWNYDELDFIPVILVTASRMVKGEGIEGEYIQGAGDDAENWLKEAELTPELFWKWHKELLQASTEEQLQEKLKDCLQRERTEDPSPRMEFVQIKPTASLFVCKVSDSNRKIVLEDDVIKTYRATIIFITDEQPPPEVGHLTSKKGQDGVLPPPIPETPSSLPLPTGSSLKIAIPRSLLSTNNTKRSSKLLRTQILPQIHKFITSTHFNDANEKESNKILLVCPMDGKRGGGGVDIMRDIICASMLFISCILYNEEGQMYQYNVDFENRDSEKSFRPVIDKQYIYRRLAWVITSLSSGITEEVNVSRASLLAVNSVLMS